MGIKEIKQWYVFCDKDGCDNYVGKMGHGERSVPFDSEKEAEKEAYKQDWYVGTNGVFCYACK